MNGTVQKRNDLNYITVCGDCIETMNDHIADQTIDMVLCDMPYGMTRNKWDTVINLDAMWQQVERIIKPKGAVVLFSGGMFTAMLMNSNRKWWRYNLVWQKANPVGFLNARRQPLRIHEDICVFASGQTIYNPQMTQGHKPENSSPAQEYGNRNYNAYQKPGKRKGATDRFPVSVLRFPNDPKSKSLHPTQKPVALCEWLIKTYSYPGNIVLDFCMGSGSTGVACVNTGRAFIGIDNDQHYFDVATRRIGGDAA